MGRVKGRGEEGSPLSRKPKKVDFLKQTNKQKRVIRLLNSNIIDGGK